MIDTRNPDSTIDDVQSKQRRLIDVKAEIADLKKRLEEVRGVDEYTARWYGDRLQRLDLEKRELEWDLH